MDWNAGLIRAIRRSLLAWYGAKRRELPWRRTSDPYRIWISEIMLQQTRARAVIPYYERFLARFPNVEALAAAGVDEVLAHWSGLGYYSRARHLHRAARQIAAAAGFPREYGAIRSLPGVGDYTAAAVASIAFGLPHAVLDGNVLRVLARLRNEGGEIHASATRARLHAAAAQLLDRRRPGIFNQALMELGATVCLPRAPQCGACPLAAPCAGRQAGTAEQLPVRRKKTEPVQITATLVIAQRGHSLLFWRRDEGRMSGFWELPEASQLPELTSAEPVGVFRHTITHHHFTFQVVAAKLARRPKGFRWIARQRLKEMPVSTTARKALALCSGFAKVL